MNGWPELPEASLAIAHHKSGRTIGELRSELCYDSDSGVITSAKRTEAVAGHADRSKGGYWYVYVFKFRYRAHVLIFALYHGRWPSQQIDHIDGNKLNNAIANLRDVSPRINVQNQLRPQVGTAGGLLGIKRCSGGNRWEAQITALGRYHYLGSFRTASEAHQAYIAAKCDRHPESFLAMKAKALPSILKEAATIGSEGVPT